MARRAMSVCSTPGCPELTEGGRCKGCQERARVLRRATKRKPYDRAAWSRTRLAYLRANPYCECDECMALSLLLRPLATEVNHIDGLGPLGPRGHDWTNLQSMTKAHHSRITAREQPGGWNDRNM
jgi:5-methylcytosine-specific restriction protein A